MNLHKATAKMLVGIHEMILVGAFEPKISRRVYILEVCRHDDERCIWHMEPAASSHLYTAAILFLIGGEYHLDFQRVPDRITRTEHGNEIYGEELYSDPIRITAKSV
jgi:hypothetical protein